MDLFSYLIIGFSLFYTAAVMRLIGGLASATRKESRYSVHVLFIIFTILAIAFSFWTYWSFKEVDWTFPKFLTALLDPGIFYFIATVLIPENSDKIKSWRTYYYNNKDKFFSAAILWVVYISFNGTILLGLPLNHPGRIGGLLGLIAAIIGLRSSKHKVHLIVALFFLLQILIMSFTIGFESAWLLKL